MGEWVETLISVGTKHMKRPDVGLMLISLKGASIRFTFHATDKLMFIASDFPFFCFFGPL